VIIDLRKFVAEERSYWTELETMLALMEKESTRGMDLPEIKRFHYLYQRTSADLARIMTFSSEPQIRRYLESLVGRAYGEIHETRQKAGRIHIRHWVFQLFPQTFRKHIHAFMMALAVLLAGGALGGVLLMFEPSAKEALLPFSHLKIDPAERVADEEKTGNARLQKTKTSFSSYLMTHNARVAILALALGITWGLGTIILLFGNGVLLGAVVADYIRAGESVFLMGWLLPHGAVELPAIILAGQAGLVLAGALIGWGDPISLSSRLRSISRDLVILIVGVFIMLVWAGIIEAFLSQYHEPVIPYGFKIALGLVELIFLCLFLGLSGASKKPPQPRENVHHAP
jgi:uncharacterized membrane protein SpoIIM required for sporulation